MTLKTIDSFIATVDPDRATVVSFPEFIAIFGGAISLQKKRKKPKSKRDAFYWWILEHRKELKELLLLPENYNDWSDFAIYSDLLLFEKDLGHLTSAVLVFLESPGSIAELGAFSQIDSLSERLIVVVADEHHPKRSFISLGPIRSITETQKHQNGICVIPNVKPEQLVEHISVIVGMLDKKRQRIQGTARFNKKSIQHEILFILDFINLFLVIQIIELQQLASDFGLEINLPRLKQILFLLEKTELITCQHYGDNQYYIPRNFRKKYVDYTSKAEASPFKRETTKALVWDEIQKDQHLKSVFKLANKEGAAK